jgi:hypothetical protein
MYLPRTQIDEWERSAGSLQTPTIHRHLSNSIHVGLTESFLPCSHPALIWAYLIDILSSVFELGHAI